MASADIYIATELLVANEDWAATGPLLIPLCEYARVWDAVWTTVDNSDDYTGEPWSKMAEDERAADGSESCTKMVSQHK
jgi:hypothetical protein